MLDISIGDCAFNGGENSIPDKPLFICIDLLRGENNNRSEYSSLLKLKLNIFVKPESTLTVFSFAKPLKGI